MTRAHLFLRKIAILLPVIIGAHHIAMTALFLSPSNLFRNKMNGYVQNYMHPFFHQNWHLFSPNPGITKNRIWVRCKSDNEDQWTKWFDPVEELRTSHDRFPFTGHGKLLYVYRELKKRFLSLYRDNLKSVVPVEHDSHELIVKKSQQSNWGRICERFASDICLESDSAYKVSQFSVMEFYPVKYSERNMGKEWDRVTRVESIPAKKEDADA